MLKSLQSIRANVTGWKHRDNVMCVGPSVLSEIDKALKFGLRY